MASPRSNATGAMSGVRSLEGATWLDRNWMFLGLYIGVVCFFCARRSGVGSQRFLAWILVPVFALHQFEEHAYDVFKREYAYLDYFNAKAAPAGFQLTMRQVTLTNIIMAWVGLPLAAWRLEFDGDELPAAFQWALTVVHGMLHLAATLQYGYNPGAAQCLFMVPLGVVYLRQVARVHGKLAVAAALAYGVPVSPIVAGLLPLRLLRQESVSDKTLALWLALLSCYLPLVLGPLFRRRHAKRVKLA